MYKWLTSLVVCLLTITQQSYADSAILDGFDGLEGWSVAMPDGVALEIAQDEGHSGSGMRLDFDFHGGGGYLVARKKLTVPLPANYAFSFQVRGEAPDNDFEFKLLDSSEKEIWWAKRREFSFPAEWKKITVKKRHLEFAWGPSGGEALKEAAVVEFGISAGTGGKGSVWIDDLMFEERPVSEYSATPLVKASTTENGYDPAKVFDGDASSSWKSGSIADEQWLLIDFQRNSEYGGLIIDWLQDDYAKAYDVQISDDGENWQRVFSVEENNGGRDYVYLPDLESRFVRLDLQRSSRGRGYGIAAIEVKPYQFSTSPNNLFTAVAADSPRGDYPRYLTGEQAYWTVVGVSGDEKEALLNQDGLLEVDKEHFSIEPFLYIDEGLIGWNDVKLTHELENQYLPIPSVIWDRAGLELRITALAAGQAGNSSLYAKYRVENHTKQRQQGRLFLALRPFQVNPPWQSLNMDGGAAPIREMFYDDNTVFVDNGKALTSLSTAERFGAVTFAQGSIMGYLHKGHLPVQTDVVDSFGYASGALEYSFDLPPGGAKSFYITIPFHQSRPLVEASLSEDQTQQLWHTAFEATRHYWESKLSSVEVQLPRSADKLVKTLKSTVAYILINQDGPAIQPGSRAYDRSWIRDGALTAAALLRMGHTKEVREFIEWYGKFQWPNGKIPCCVDWRGRDPIDEHDSHGQWIYLVMEYYRFTRDVGFLTEMWPRIDSAINYIVWLRKQRLTDEYKTPEKLIFYGLVPESVSHEGYMDAPVHSYWDDLFVLRGLKDATNGAVILGEKKAAQRFSSLRDTFRNDLMTSMERSMALHRVDYIPGAAELGDFDSNATTIGLDPVGETSALPQEALRSTFDMYYEILSERINEDKDWRVYTPYELRAVGAFIRMGHKDRAHEALEFFFQGQHPQAWNHWAEVVWRDPKTPRYIGDMPHTWVGSDYIRSIRSMFVYERESDHALIIGEGVLADWVISDQGLSIKRLPTHYGTLNYSMHMSENGLSVSLSGDVNIPPGKIVIRSPLNAPLSGVTVNGKPIKTFNKDEVIVDEFPAEIMLYYKTNARTAQTIKDARSGG